MKNSSEIAKIVVRDLVEKAVERGQFNPSYAMPIIEKAIESVRDEGDEQIRKYKNEWVSACERERSAYAERESNQKELLQLKKRCAELEAEIEVLKQAIGKMKEGAKP